MIYFVKDTSTFQITLPGETLCLYYKKYENQLPTIPNAAIMPFTAFQAQYRKRNLLSGIDNIVFVGTNRIITPSNRTKPVFELLFTGTRNINKISVDNVPFISQPWRFWFHFGITNTIYSDYDYSYAAETDYDKFQDELSDYNPFSLEEMVRWSKETVKVNYNAYFVDYEIIEIKLFPDVVDEYNTLKDKLLDTEPNINSVLRKLKKFAKARCRERSIPQLHSIFNNPNGLRIIKTNLGIDNYLTQQLVNIIKLINNYLREMYNENCVL